MGKQRVLLLAGVALLLAVLASACGPRGPQWRGPEQSAVSPQAVEGGVRFSLFEPKAKKVNIVGDFNNWSKLADPMYDTGREGLWTLLIALPAGRYEYKFLVDGERWMPDPGNPKRVKDGFDGYNSVVIVEK
jgi:1,4-alpha-glucan branching enzyme